MLNQRIANPSHFDESKSSAAINVLKSKQMLYVHSKNSYPQLKNQGEGILSGGHNTSTCNKLYEEIFSTMSHMASTFYSCVLNTTKFVSSNVQTLTDSAKKLHTNLAQDFHKLSQCFKHPANLTECATKVRHFI